MGKSEEYKAAGAGGTAAKAACRKRWAEDLWKTLESKKRRTHSSSISDQFGSKGEMMNFANLCIALGGIDLPEAVEAAKKYAAACQRFGGTWISYNAMTEQTEYRYVKSVSHSLTTDVYKLESEQSAPSLVPTFASIERYRGGSEMQRERDCQIERERASERGEESER